jgi:hypothetical protein
MAFVEKSGLYDSASLAATSREMYNGTLSNEILPGHALRNVEFIIFSNRKA